MLICRYKWKRIMHAFLSLFLLSLSAEVSYADYVEIGGLPATVTVHEDVSTTTFLYSVTSYPRTATCSISAGNTGSQFAIATANDQHTVSTIASPSLSHSTLASYQLTIECTSGTKTDSKDLTVNLIANSAPVFTNLPGTVTISARTVKANHVIFTVSYTDTDDAPPLTYSNLAGGGTFFTIADDQLKVTSDLLSTPDSSYTLTFDVADKRTTTNQQITVTVDDINAAPVFVGATDVTKNIAELTSGRLFVYDIESTDANTDQIQFTYDSVDPNNSIFDLVGASEKLLTPSLPRAIIADQVRTVWTEIRRRVTRRLIRVRTVRHSSVYVFTYRQTQLLYTDSAGEVYLIRGNTLDYEARAEYILHVRVSDYLVTAATTFTLTVGVIDVNEAPTFIGTINPVSVNEGALNDVIGIPSSLCTDPDGVPPDSITYAIISSTYSSKFNMDTSSAQTTFSETWDFDDKTLPSTLNLTVRCTDSKASSDDAIFTITILDVNDNDPVCSPVNTSFQLTYNQTVSETIQNVVCTDADSDENANLQYSIIGLPTGYGRTYFTVDTSGNVSIKTAFTMTINTTFYVTVLVHDNGTSQRSASVTFTITYTEEPVVIVHEDESTCFTCTTTAITLIAAISFVFLMFAIFLIVLWILRCCYDYEQWKIRKTLSKKKKKKWRFCGCCRPEKQRRRKVKQPEIERAQKIDRDYMRARNTLLGTDSGDFGDTYTHDAHRGSVATISSGDMSKRRRHGSVTPASGARGPSIDSRERVSVRSGLPSDRASNIFREKQQRVLGPGSSNSGAGTSKVVNNTVWSFPQ